MPAGPAPAPRTFPGGLALLARLPEGEVHRLLLALIHLDPGARLQVFDPLLGELAVARKALHGKKNVAVHPVGQPLLFQAADQRDDLGNVRRRSRLMRGRGEPQARAVLGEFPDVALRDRFGGHALLVGPLDDLVVHIGKIAHEGHLVAEKPEVAVHHVKGQQEPGMADMRGVIDRDPAYVHPHLPFFERNKRLFFP